MEFLKQKKWLGAKELDNLAVLKEDPVVMAKLRARQVAEAKKVKKTIATYKTPAEVLRFSVQGVKGAWVKRSFAAKKWTARYPGVAPAHRARTWSGAVTEAQCARHCLIWQWRQHVACGGKPSPYNFGVI